MEHDSDARRARSDRWVACAGLAFSIALAALSRPAWSQGVEDAYTDLVLGSRDGVASPAGRAARIRAARVVLVDVSRRDAGRPRVVGRDELARIVSSLGGLGVWAIGLDLMLDARETTPDDERLQRALRDSGRVVLASWYHPDTLVETVPALASESRSLGMINLAADPDGCVRRVQHCYDAPGITTRLSFSLALASVALSYPTTSLAVPRVSDDSISFSSAAGLVHRISIDAEGLSKVPYLGAPGTIPCLSLEEIRRMERERGRLTGKVVVLGNLDPLGPDRIRLPAWRPGAFGRICGAEVHAQITSAILSGWDPRPARWTFEVPILLAWIGIAAWASRCARPLVAALLVGAALAAHGFACLALFTRANVALDFVFPLAVASGWCLTCRASRAVRSVRRRLAGQGTGHAPAAPAVQVPLPFDMPARYANVTFLGKGGMGTVYQADDRVLGFPVAIKVPDAALMIDPSLKTRFLREIQALAKLNHPNVIRLFDASADGLSYYTMELVRGETLRNLLDREGPLSTSRALALLAPIAHALAASHAVKLVHRDVKPDNILIDEAGVPRLTDYGLVLLQDQTRVTRSVAFFGTPIYMAPEQLEGGEPTAAVDVYAFGVVLFEALAAHPPFDIQNVFRKVLEPAPPVQRSRTEAPSNLARFIATCLEMRPLARFSDGRALVEALEVVIGEVARPAPHGEDGV